MVDKGSKESSDLFTFLFLVPATLFSLDTVQSEIGYVEVSSDGNLKQCSKHPIPSPILLAS